MDPVRFTTGPVTGPVTFTLDAAGTALLAEIIVDPDATKATAQLSGPPEVTGTAADVDIDHAETIRVRTVSGDITARTVSGAAWLHTTSGDVTVDGAAGPVTAETVSGDIRVHATAPVTIDAGSISGDIRVTAGPGICPGVHAQSVSGRVRTGGKAGSAR